VLTLMRSLHPNVIQFRGVNMTLFQLALVYNWGENGNIIEYAVSHPDVSRMGLVRVTIAPVERAEWSLMRFVHDSC
jgi:hypothetical protein